MPMTFGEFLKTQRADLPIPPASQIAGGVYIVTGAGHGLGLQCAKHLVRLGAKRVIIAVRSVTSGESGQKEIEIDTGRKGVAEVWKLDLASYDSVKSFVRKAIQELDRIDGLIENAAIALDKWTISEGLETTLTVNVVSTFLLALLLFPKMKNDAKRLDTTPHTVILTSGLGFSQEKDFQKLAKQGGDVFDNLNIEGKWPLDDNARYAISKLLEIVALRPLATLLPVSESGVVINMISPGLCNTGLARYSESTWNRLKIRTANAIIGRTPEMGSRTLLHAVTAGKESHGKYCSDCEIKEHHLPDWVTDEAGRKMQKTVWDQLSQRLALIEPSILVLFNHSAASSTSVL